MANKFISPNNGGIGGTGVHAFFGSVVQCKNDDDSFYCNFTKIFNIIIMVAIVSFIIYFIYSLLKNSLSGKKK